MSHEVQYVLEIKRMLWLMASVFCLVIIAFQYFEFRYGSYLFSASNVHVTVNQISLPDNTLVNGNQTTYRGLDVGVGKDFASESKQVFHDSTESERNHVSVDQVEKSKKLKFDMVEKNQGNLEPEKARDSEGNLSIDNVTNAANLVHKSEEIARSEKGRFEKRKRKVVSVSQMLDILVHNRASSRSMKPKWASIVDQELFEAKLQIENPPVVEKDHTLHGSVFRNISMFKRSYELMEKMLKVYIYKEGEKPIFHQPQAVLKGIYASEGWFMKQMKASKRFVTKKPKKAHLFYIPYSSKLIKATLSPNSYDPTTVILYLKNYLDVIVGRYNFWNRTGGSDHFLVACHDWAAAETRQYMETCIRALCNTDVEREAFMLGKDASLPETNIRYPSDPLRQLGGKPPSKRSILAFFAGKMHGNVRPVLLRHWENKDPEMKISGKLIPTSKDDRSYVELMKSSKYCICAKGSEVNSPRVVEAIFYECVPVIISDNFVPPFFEILDWEAFAVFVQEKDIPNLKNILMSISNRRYLMMQQRVKEVQQHFLWHVKPVKYDIFHMILHSIWYNRVFRVNPR